MDDSQFSEKRQEYRLPFGDRVIFSDGKQAMTAYAANLSRGGLFVNSLSPFPIDTTGYLAFLLPNQPASMCLKAKVVHIIFDRQRCEVECGMGFQFVDLNESQRSILNLHILNEQAAYMDLKKLLAESSPDLHEIEKRVRKIPSLAEADLLSLRYRVNRVCAIFEPAPDPFAAQQPAA